MAHEQSIGAADGQRERGTREPAARRRDLDRLRAAACLTTILYHAIQIFDLNPYYHIKSVTPSPGIDVAARLLHAVRMPLFFLIAGMVAYAAIGRLGDRTFLQSRARRLLPPFVLGIVLLTPWIKYFEVLDGRSITWAGIVTLSGPPPDLAVVLRRYFTQFRWFTWSHMWFPVYLLLLSAVLLPAMRRMAVARWRPAAWTGLALAAPLGVLLLIELLLRPIFPFHIPNLFWDWASMAVYVTCFLAGSALMRWTELELALNRWLPVTMLAALCGLVAYVGVDAGFPLANAGRALWLWGLLAVVIGAGPLLRRGTIAGERYLIEGALPIYVLHHVPLVAVGFVVKDLPWPIWQRYGLIVGVAFLSTLAIYHALVRPFDAVRFAFGMPPRRRT